MLVKAKVCVIDDKNMKEFFNLVGGRGGWLVVNGEWYIPTPKSDLIWSLAGCNLTTSSQFTRQYVTDDDDDLPD